MSNLPARIGRYIIKAELGRGGMATVYQAEDPRFKRDVAVKVMPPQFLNEPMFRARFEREAQTIAALEHPAIVPVYDFGEENGEMYLVMRYMTGGSLLERMAKGPIPPDETLRIIARLADALDQVHAHGIVHRDLKPANVLFDQYGNAFLSDFGIARLAEASANLTGDAIIGTPAYMSPEQARGDKEIDGRSDIYALGAILFQMLSGKQPYEATTPFGIAMKHITDPVPSIRQAKSDLPEDSDRIIERAMAKDPSRRYQHSSELASDLETLVSVSSRPKAPATLVEPEAPASAISAEPLRTAPAKEPAAAPPASATGMPRPPSERIVTASPVHTPPPGTMKPVSKPVSQSLPKKPAASGKKGLPVWAAILGGLGILVLCGGLAVIAIPFLLPMLFPGTPDETAIVQQTVEPQIPVEATESYASTPRVVTIFIDDFSDPASGWERGTDSSATTDYDAGGYRIFVDRPNMTYASRPNLLFEDVIIQVEATKIAGADENYFGVICRFQDYSNFYTVAIMSDGYYSFGKFVNDDYEFLDPNGWQYSSAIHTGTTTNLIRVECVGDTISLYVNNLIVDKVTDSTFSTGDVGLIAAAFDMAGTNILFDNFRAEEP